MPWRAVNSSMRAVTPLAESLGGGEEWRTRTALTLAVLAGFDLMRRVLKSDALNRPEAKVLLERALRACLTGPL